MSRRGSKHKSLIDLLPRSATALVWALAAMHWRSGKKYAGADYDGLRALLGTQHRSALRRVVSKAESVGAVRVVVGFDARGRRRPNIRLTYSTLHQLEELWHSKKQ